MTPAPICSGTAFTYAGLSATAGATFSWTRATVAGISQAGTSGAVANISETLTNTTAVPINVTYVYTLTANTCAGPAENVVVAVNPAPLLSSTQSPAAICSGTFTYTATSATAGTTFSWTRATVAGISQAGTSGAVANISETLTNTTANPLNVTYVYTLTANSCNNTQNVVVSVNPAPLLSSTLTPPAVCSGTLFSYTATSATVGAGFSWTRGSVAGITPAASSGLGGVSETLTNATAGPLNVTYVYTTSVNGCPGPVQNVVETINPSPDASAGNIVICSGTATNVVLTNPNGVSGTQFKWTVFSINVSGANNQPGPVAGPINDLLTATTNAQGTATYTITPVSPAGCSGAPYVATVTVQPLPSFSFVNSSMQICSGSQTNILLNTPTSGGQVRLKSVNYNGVSGTLAVGYLYSDGQSITEVLSNSTNAPITVTYQFEAVVGTCAPSASQSTTVVVNPNPTFTINNSTPVICSGTQPSITLNSPTVSASITLQNVTYGSLSGGLYASGGTFSSGAVITESAGGLVNTTNSPISVTYTFSVGTLTAPSCPLSISTQSTVVQVLPAPSFSYVNGASIICSGNQADITLNTTVSGEQIRLKSVSYGSIIGTLSSGLLYSNGQKITEVLVNPTNSPATVTYQFEAIVAGCSPSAVQSTNVIVNPTPVFSITNGTPSVCEGSPVNITLNSPTSSAVITLSAINYNGMTGTLSPGATFANGQNIAETISTPFTTTTIATYSFTVAASGCSNPVVQQTTVALTKQATVSLPANYTVCQPTTIALTGTIGGSAITGLWSIVSGAGSLSSTNVSGSTATANYTVASTDVSGVVAFRLTTNDPDGSGPCGAAFANISVTINRAAQVFAPANLALCQNIAGIALGGSIGGSTTATIWSGGLGTFSNVNDPNATYSFKNPNEVNTTVLLTLTALDPDGAGPCAAVSTPTNLKINMLPVVTYTGFPAGAPPQLAENNLPITLTGNQIGGLFTISPATSNIGSTTASPVDKVTFNPSAVTLGLNVVTYTYTDFNGCTNSNSQQVLINPVTTVDFTIQNGFLDPAFEWEICANQYNSFTIPNPSPTLIRLIPNTTTPGLPPETGFSASVGNGNPSNTMTILHIGAYYYIETKGLPADTYFVTYTYKNIFNAITFKTYPVIVHASPVAGIAVASNCIASAISFNDASVVNPLEPIVSWRWDFGDGTPPVYGQNPTHSYSIPKIYKVILQTTTSFGCSDTTSTKVRVGAVPVTKFNVSSICNNDSTKFKDLTTNPGGVSRIVKYTWDFGDGSPLLVGDSTTYGTAWNKGNVEILPLNVAGTFKNPFHRYTTASTYQAKLTVLTNDGCNNSVQKRFFILPYSTITPLPGNAYTENFESSTGGWQVESLQLIKTPLDSSWIWTVPNGIKIKSGTKSWWTGLNNGTYGINESSAVNGPCFNLSSLDRPMIAMDYWHNTPTNTDGAVLQYSVDGGNTWVNVGVPQQGINWYSTNLIASNPGIQPVGFGPYGWSDTTQTAWRRGSFNLDGLPAKRNQVRVRVAFAGDASRNIQRKLDGFAFDNVFVGNKTKNVLVEEFTNANLSAGLGADAWFNNLYSNQTVLRNGNSDFHNIQYHVRFPNPDVFNQANSDDPAARALFYGVQQPPYAVLDGLQNADGISFGTNYFNIDPIEIDRRALRKPQINIYKVDTVATGKNNTINARIHIQADTAITFPLYAQVALVEDSIVVPPFANPFRNVVRKLLYSGAGFTSTATMQPGDSLIITNGAVSINTPITNPKKLYLVAFVQNFNTKELIQSLVVPVKYKTGSLITGIESSVAALERIQIYPNPADGKFNFALPGDFPSGSVYKISDQRGINVLSGDFNDALKGMKQVDVSSLTNGMYIVAVGAPGQSVVYKKLVVLNSN